MNKWICSFFRAGLLAGFWLATMVGGARADIASEWNAMAQFVIREEGLQGPEASRLYAMLNTAIYNAVEGIAGDHYLYTSGTYDGPSATAEEGASMEAAAATAATTLLQNLYPWLSGEFSTLHSDQMNLITSGQSKTAGTSFGFVVANDIVNWRNTDGAANASDPGLYTPVGTVGHWQPTAPATGALPGWGNVATFGITSTAGFTGSLPGGSAENFLLTAQYATDYNQVKELGALSGSTRSADQLEAAQFWSVAQETLTTAGIWNQIAQSVVGSEGLSLQDSARLFAAMNVAMADAAIVTWETNYDVDLWSPLQAIVNGGADGNPATLADEEWAALLEALNIPAYFSEQAALSAAAARILSEFLGDNVAFQIGVDVDGDGIIDFTRDFDSFSEAAAEAGQSQIWGGIGFGTGYTDSDNSGTAVADYVLGNHFAPVPEPSGVLLMLVGASLFSMRRRRGSVGRA